jgi:diguanylate cyclase (GGDEF)-like protein
MIMSKFMKKRTVSVQSEMVFIMVLISTVSLLLAASMFTYIQLRDYRSSMVESLSSTAAIIAENVQAAVLFDNVNDADNILSEFKTDQRILIAAIYKNESIVFSSYKLIKETVPASINFLWEDEKYLFEDNYLHLYQPITIQSDDNIIGYVYLKASLDSLYQQLNQNILVTVIIVLLSLLVTILLTSRLQKIISDPIRKLLSVTDIIKNEKDYSLRVEPSGFSEVQQLCDGLNSMLSEIQSRDEHMQHLATYDVLTNLPNRKYFIDILNQAISRAERKSQRHAILFMDLDRFKHVNDSLGHSVGDELLVQVARRLAMIIRGDDIVARFGGDEFTFLLQDVPSSNQVAEVADRILEVLCEPFDMHNHKVVVSPSIGIVLFPDNGIEPEDLLKKADTAMYRAKSSGGNNYLFFTESMNEEAHFRLELEEDLRNALIQDQFIVHYQPKINLDTGEISGMEALARWERNGNGLVPPNEFIPVAEETGLIVPLGNKILEKAVIQANYLNNNHLFNNKVAINISAKQFRQVDLIEHIKHTLTEYDLRAEYLEFEITEATVMDNISEAISIMSKIKDIGISLAMDDFGTGYSSLSYLKMLPFDTLKIDMSFIRDMEESEVNASIVKTIIDLAHTLKLEVVAEGVEEIHQAIVLRDMGCDVIQGYLYSKPLDKDGIVELLKNNQNLYDLKGFPLKDRS